MTKNNEVETGLVFEQKEGAVLEVATQDAAVNVSVDAFNEGNLPMFSTIKATDRASKVKLYNAISDSENSLDDNKGVVLEITDMVAHPITLQDEQTGEDVQAMRVVLVDKDGVGYHAVSQGIVSSMQRIIGIVGQGPWSDDPLKITVVEKKTRKGFKTLTVKLV